jgi:hypothetical protein
MDIAALFKVFQSWGPSAISSALIIAVAYLVKQLHENGKADAQRSKEMAELLNNKLNGLRTNIEQELDEHNRKLSYIELEYVKRETFFRDLSGWKDDINRLSGQLSAQFMEFTKFIIELWKDKKD